MPLLPTPNPVPRRAPPAPAVPRPLGQVRLPARQPRPWPLAARGFTLVELITVMVLAAVLAAVVAPRIGPTIGLAGAAWRDQVHSALLQARTIAQGHRRLVCAAVATNEVRLTLASANPATSCNTTFAGHDGDARWARDSRGLAIAVSPTGTLYFQPDGRITSDGAGSTPVNVSIAISGETTITVVGETGHVQ